MRYILSFPFVFGSDNDVYQFALCYPYSYSKHRNQLELWEDFCTNKLSSGLMQSLRFEVKSIGKSLVRIKINSNIDSIVI